MRRRRARVAARKQPSSGDRCPVENRIRAARVEQGLSQAELADAAGLTRQAIYSIESSHYMPNVTTALRLARTLHRRVEDLFGLEPAGTLLEGELLGQKPGRPVTTRAKVWSVGKRTLVLPVASLGAGLTYSTPGEFRAEAFNLTNTPPLGAPNGVLGSPGFGSITSAGDPRVVQLGLKVTF